jgi:methanethiol S-methyltransferase
VFLASFAYAVPFVGDFLVPRTVDTGPTAPTMTALLVNAAVLLLFALQHSVMARKGFKRWWTRFVPQPIERSTYVLFASLALILVFVAWRPLPAVVWDVGHEGLRTALWALFGIGWGIVFVATFMIGHADLFGLAQVWRALVGSRPPDDRFRVPGLYRLVRHPIMTGFLIAFWATPTMTAGHLLFAAATTGYILIAVRLEERDLVTRFGALYREYRRRVPAFFPLPTPSGREVRTPAEEGRAAEGAGG